MLKVGRPFCQQRGSCRKINGLAHCLSKHSGKGGVGRQRLEAATVAAAAP